MSKSTKDDATGADFNPFGDLTKMFEQLKVPGIDVTAIVDERRKDVEALIAANKAAYEGMQALASKQTEIFQQAVQGIQDAAKGMASGADTGDAHARQAELARKAYEKTLTDMKDLAEIARKSQTDAMASITQRATQNMLEIKKMMQPK